MSENKWERFWKSFWFIVWKDESLKGWIISIIFIFIIIKFIFFPLLSLATGTSLPLAIVESCSMYHQGNAFSDYDSWWNRHNVKYQDWEISKEQFKEFMGPEEYWVYNIICSCGKEFCEGNPNHTTQNFLIHKKVMEE